jgi:DNA-binding winged helix-turn-helix (wHTH) protein/tetratricopeptide (TPR) repeat protein
MTDRFPSHRYTFGTWTVEPATLRIVRAGTAVNLERCTMAVLVELLEHAGEVVSADALLEAVWSDRFVEPIAVQRNVSLLRRALGDDSRHPRFIETIRARGYRTVAPVEHVDLVPSASSSTVVVREFTAIPDEPNLVAIAQAATDEVVSALKQTRLVVTRQPTAVRADATPERFDVSGLVRRTTDGSVEVALCLTHVGSGRVLWSDRLACASASAGLPGAPFVARTIESELRAERWSKHLREETHTAARAAFRAAMKEFESASLGAGGTLRAIEHHLDTAIRLDPEFATAHNIYAVRYSLRLGEMRAVDALPRAHDHVRKALAIDPDATWGLAYVNVELDCAWEEAFANLAHAPRFATGQAEMLRGFARSAQGRFEEAIEHFRFALSYGAVHDQPATMLQLATALGACGRHASARDVVNDALACYRSLRHGQALTALLALAEIELLCDDAAAAEATFERAWSLHGSRVPWAFAAAAAALGRSRDAHAMLAQAERRYASGALAAAGEIFRAHYLLGQLEPSLPWLERAVENREYWFLPWLRSPSCFRDLHGHPRFVATLRALASLESLGSPTRSVATGARSTRT